MYQTRISKSEIPGPDLAWQDAVMESQAFITSEYNCISTSRRARAGRNNIKIRMLKIQNKSGMVLEFVL